jgi:thiol-disulfide isomerase/thioredoxin
MKKMAPTTRACLLLGLVLAATAGAAGLDARGWTLGGTPAIDAAAVLAGHTDLQTVLLPKAVMKQVAGPTVLVYFSPSCPHCQHVARELQDLADRLDGGGKAKLVGVASSSSTPDAIQEFRQQFGVRFEIVIDEEGGTSRALGIRSTPSAALVRPKSAREVEVVDLWFPYVSGLDALVEGRVNGDVMSVFEPGRYQGTTFCATCHGQEYQAWQLTHHAVAWHTLVRKESTTDPKCVGCHVTGNKAPTGWDGAEHSKLEDVGCESCHGPGGPHDGQVTEAASTCAACHDADHSVGFDLAVALPLIDHYRATTMTEDERYARRMALSDGTALQELIRFSGGKNLGPSACISCHAEQHAAWVQDPHSRAMTTLQSKGSSSEPGCVACHATPKEAGPAPTELAGFRLFEGVGCESCHGPGEAHVAAAGAPGTIEGLGDDCPVCVIEAVCTSCHTREMDPTWDLKVDLPKVAHTRP